MYNPLLCVRLLYLLLFLSSPQTGLQRPQLLLCITQQKLCGGEGGVYSPFTEACVSHRGTMLTPGTFQHFPDYNLSLASDDWQLLYLELNVLADCLLMIANGYSTSSFSLSSRSSCSHSSFFCTSLLTSCSFFLSLCIKEYIFRLT